MNELSDGWGTPKGTWSINSKLHYFVNKKSLCSRYKNGYVSEISRDVRSYECCQRCYERRPNDLTIQ